MCQFGVPSTVNPQQKSLRIRNKLQGTNNCSVKCIKNLSPSSPYHFCPQPPKICKHWMLCANTYLSFTRAETLQVSETDGHTLVCCKTWDSAQVSWHPNRTTDEMFYYCDGGELEKYSQMCAFMLHSQELLPKCILVHRAELWGMFSDGQTESFCILCKMLLQFEKKCHTGNRKTKMKTK